MYDFVIKNGTVVTAEKMFLADVGVVGEKIAGISPNIPTNNAKTIIDATGKLVIPGGVDGHVHLQYHVGGYRSADDFFTGTRAAAMGGTTAIIDFAEAKPDQPLLAAFADRNAEAAGQAVVDYSFHMTITPTDMGKLGEVAGVVNAGIPTFKHYMAYGFCLNDGQLLQSFSAIAQANGLAIVHAENWDVIQALVAQNIANGNVDPTWHPRSRPAIFEGQAARRAIDLARWTNVPLYIFHVSCGEVVAEMQKARQEGLQVWGETCPQYLVLDESVFAKENGELAICSPPIRDKAQQAKLWQAVTDGDLQVISTDHCPFTIAEKQQGRNFSQVPGGVPGIESRLMLLYHFGVNQGRLTLSQWVDRCCTTPAKLFGFENKGKIEVGFDADLVVFDPEQEMVLSTDTLHEAVDWTGYAGISLTGTPIHTFSRGNHIINNRQFTNTQPHGKFQPRHLNQLVD